MLGDLGSYVGVSALVIVTPGQDTALVIRNALAGGRRGGVFTALGVVAGQATWTLAAGIGLTALLIASRPAFTALKLAGAAYLVWLGVQSLHRAWSRGGPKPDPTNAASKAGVTPRAAFSQGLLSALGNPKLAAFFLSLFPQFLPHDRSAPLALFVLGLTFCGMTLAWLTGYSMVLGKSGRPPIVPGVRRALEAALGATLVAIGLTIATEHERWKS